MEYVSVSEQYMQE